MGVFLTRMGVVVVAAATGPGAATTKTTTGTAAAADRGEGEGVGVGGMDGPWGDGERGGFFKTGARLHRGHTGCNGGGGGDDGNRGGGGGDAAAAADDGDVGGGGGRGLKCARAGGPAHVHACRRSVRVCR